MHFMSRYFKATFMFPTNNPITTSAWPKLELQFLTLQATHLRELFSEDPERFSMLQAKFEDILVDYSKNLIVEETLKGLIDLAREVELKDAIVAMFSGMIVNQTEGRSVLHVALRNRSNTPVMVDGENVMHEVNRVLEQMKNFSTRLLSGEWKGYTGKQITDILFERIDGRATGPGRFFQSEWQITVRESV